MSDVTMKKLSSHILVLYIILTLVPLLIFAGVDMTKSLIQEKKEHLQLYDQVLSQQLLNAQKSLEKFDLPVAELVVNDLSRLEYITSVKLESEQYEMTLAEVINEDSSLPHINKLVYPIVDADDHFLGQLIIHKDNEALSKDIYYLILPRTILLILLVGLLSYIFSYKILSVLRKPFDDVQQFTQLVARGEFAVSPPKHNRFSEINSIFTSLETMRLRLFNSINQLKQSEERYSRTYNLTQVCLFVVNVKTCQIVRANIKFSQLIGEIDKINEQQEELLEALITQLLRRKSGSGFEYSLSDENGKIHFQINHSKRIKDEIECSALDISDLIEAREFAELQMKTDSLTAIPNRVSFNNFAQQVEKGIYDCFTFMMLDLNGFKVINDSHGHDAGDAVLQVIASRLERVTSALGAVYRLGGDEFIITLIDPFSEQQLRDIANTVVQAVEQPIEFNGLTLFVSVSVGISSDDTDSVCSVKNVLHNADVAMYYAKANDLPPVFYLEVPNNSVSPS